MKKPKSVPKPETKCFYCKGTGHWRRNCPKYLVDKKDGKVNKGILDIHVIDVYLLVFIATPQYLILVQLLKSSNSKRVLHNEHKLVKDEVTMCIGSSFKIDNHHRTLPILLGLVLKLNKCYLVFALSMNMI